MYQVTIDKPSHRHKGWDQNVHDHRQWLTTAPWDSIVDNHLGCICQMQTPGVLVGVGGVKLVNLYRFVII